VTLLRVSQALCRREPSTLAAPCLIRIEQHIKLRAPEVETTGLVQLCQNA
jgi:hypothetical protein